MKPATVREVVGEMRKNRALSERRLCAVLGFGRTTVRYRSRRQGDAPVRKRLKELSAIWKRFGYRRLHIMLRREGIRVSRDRIARMCREEGLTIRPRRKKRAGVEVEHKAHPRAVRPDECWTLDFVSDQLESGKRLRILNVVDECTRECLLSWPAFTFPSADVVEKLEELATGRGKPPQRLRSDNGSEFVASTCVSWLATRRVEHARSRPGKPTDNAIVESFNGRFRDECLNGQVFRTIKEATEITEAYRRAYNQHRPHSGLKYQTPLEYRQQLERAPLGLS